MSNHDQNAVNESKSDPLAIFITFSCIGFLIAFSVLAYLYYDGSFDKYLNKDNEMVDGVKNIANANAENQEFKNELVESTLNVVSKSNIVQEKSETEDGYENNFRFFEVRTKDAVSIQIYYGIFPGTPYNKFISFDVRSTVSTFMCEIALEEYLKSQRDILKKLESMILDIYHNHGIEVEKIGIERVLYPMYLQELFQQEIITKRKIELAKREIEYIRIQAEADEKVASIKHDQEMHRNEMEREAILYKAETKAMESKILGKKE